LLFVFYSVDLCLYFGQIGLQLLLKFLRYFFVKGFFLCFLLQSYLLNINCLAALALGWRLEVLAEVDIWMTPLVVLLDEFEADEVLRTLVALKVLAFLLVGLFQKVLIRL